MIRGTIDDFTLVFFRQFLKDLLCTNRINPFRDRLSIDFGKIAECLGPSADIFGLLSEIVPNLQLNKLLPLLETLRQEAVFKMRQAPCNNRYFLLLVGLKSSEQSTFVGTVMVVMVVGW